MSLVPSLTGIAATHRLEEIAQRQAGGWSDVEGDHAEADLVLCAVLSGEGYDDLVTRFLALKRWYA